MCRWLMCYRNVGGPHPRQWSWWRTICRLHRLPCRLPHCQLVDRKLDLLPLEMTMTDWQHLKRSPVTAPSSAALSAVTSLSSTTLVLRPIPMPVGTFLSKYVLHQKLIADHPQTTTTATVTMPLTRSPRPSQTTSSLNTGTDKLPNLPYKYYWHGLHWSRGCVELMKIKLAKTHRHKTQTSFALIFLCFVYLLICSTKLL